MPTSAEERLARVLSDQGNIYRRLLSDVFAGLLLEIGLLAIILADTWVGPELWNLATTPGSLGAFATILVAVGGGLVALAPPFGVFVNGLGLLLFDAVCEQLVEKAHHIFKSRLVAIPPQKSFAHKLWHKFTSFSIEWFHTNILGVGRDCESLKIFDQIKRENRLLLENLAQDKSYAGAFVYRLTGIIIFLRSLATVTLIAILMHALLGGSYSLLFSLTGFLVIVISLVLSSSADGYRRAMLAAHLYHAMITHNVGVDAKGRIVSHDLKEILMQLAKIKYRVI